MNTTEQTTYMYGDWGNLDAHSFEDTLWIAFYLHGYDDVAT
jgi:hypothetical protein